MKLYCKPTNSEPVDCPYIAGEKFIQRYAVMNEITPVEFDMLLTNGWRHFGYFFFMPNCPVCEQCRPIRTLVDQFKPTKSQRKNLRKNNFRIEVEFVKPEYSDEIYEIYKKHSKIKFDQNGSTVKEFKESFFSDALQGNYKLSLFKLDGLLIGVGFIDISEDGISSVYFCYDTDYSNLGLGVFSVLKEIEYAASLGKSYYYLGYYVEGNGSMEYKGKYTPSELLNWETGKWLSFKPGDTGSD